MQNIKLNLIPGSVMPVVNVSQYDKARQFALVIYEGATQYSLTGKSVQIRGTKPDGNGFAYDSTDGVVSVSGSTVTISTTQQMTAVGGQTMAELRITQSGVILGTLNFVLMVEPSALSDDTPISDTELPVLERLAEEQVEQAEAWAKGTKDGVPVSSDEPQYHDNAYWWSEIARQYAAGGLHFMGSVAFASIPTTGLTNGDMYNITDAFTTDARFIEGAGIKCNAGTNIAWLDSVSKWDILAVGGGNALNDLSDVSISSPTDGQALIYDNNSGEWKNGTVSTVGDLDDLTDVDITTPASGQVLEYDGSKWANANLPSVPSDLDDLSDVTLSSPTSGQFLKYDGSKWTNGTGGGGASALDDLTDVDITTPSDGDLLQYNSTSQEWENNSAVPDAIWALKQAGAVNKAPNQLTSQTVSGVTFTVNANGKIDKSGTATDDITLTFTTNLNLAPGAYKILGMPAAANAASYVAYGVNQALAGATTQFTLAAATTANVTIFIKSGDSASYTISVMIYDANFGSQSYLPFAMTNRELTEAVDNLDKRAPLYKQGASTFIGLTGDSVYTHLPYILDNIDISKYSNGQFVTLNNGGNAYTGVFFKHSDDYWTFLACGYGIGGKIMTLTKASSIKYVNVFGSKIQTDKANI